MRYHSHRTVWAANISAGSVSKEPRPQHHAIRRRVAAGDAQSKGVGLQRGRVLRPAGEGGDRQQRLHVAVKLAPQLRNIAGAGSALRTGTAQASVTAQGPPTRAIRRPPGDGAEGDLGRWSRHHPVLPRRLARYIAWSARTMASGWRSRCPQLGHTRAEGDDEHLLGALQEGARGSARAASVVGLHAGGRPWCRAAGFELFAAIAGQWNLRPHDFRA